MPKRYEPASTDVELRVAKLREKYYNDLDGVSVGALFVFDDDSGEPVLTHQGYPAAGLIRIVSTRDRAAGLEDAQMVIDRVIYSSLTDPQRSALIDHELHHLIRRIDKDGMPMFDAQGRPKLKIRKHDWQLGWFDEIANRHGSNSFEVMEAKRLIEESGQLYFDFGSPAPPRGTHPGLSAPAHVN